MNEAIRNREKNIRLALWRINARKPDAYSIIGGVSGLGEERVRRIAEGAELSLTELITLESLAEA